MPSSMRICIMPAKNEDWILAKTLAAASLVFDKIIIDDAGSQDRTAETARSFPKVEYLSEAGEFSISENRRQRALNKAREWGSQNIIFCLDADEILTANVLENVEFWNLVESLRPGQAMLFEWINLWRSGSSYRCDSSVWVGNFRPFAFRDDGLTDYAPGNVHESRVPNGMEKNAVQEKAVKILHYNFVLWDRMLSKQAHWRIVEFLRMNRLALKINGRYAITKNERGVKLETVTAQWLDGYEQRHIILRQFSGQSLYWYDRESLASFKRYGPAHFRWLDIWDINWEQKRQAALTAGLTEIPDRPIVDPRTFVIKSYHNLLSWLNVELLMGWYSRLKRGL